MDNGFTIDMFTESTGHSVQLNNSFSNPLYMEITKKALSGYFVTVEIHDNKLVSDRKNIIRLTYNDLKTFLAELDKHIDVKTLLETGVEDMRVRSENIEKVKILEKELLQVATTSSVEDIIKITDEIKKLKGN